MAEYTQGNFFDGFNKLSVTYGTDGFSYVGLLENGNHAGDNYTPGDADFWGIRVIDLGLIEQDKWNLGYSFMGSYKRSNFTSNVFEAGYFTKKSNDWRGQWRHNAEGTILMHTSSPLHSSSRL